jgi:hypothetical protein
VHLVVPRHETNSVVHHSQEGVHTRPFVNKTLENILVVLGKLFFFFGFHGQLEKHELSLQFLDLHALVQLEVSINSAKTSVQQFVEVNPTIVSSDTHLENLLLHFVFGLLVSVTRAEHTERCWQFLEEFHQLFFLDFLALESDGLLNPSLVKLGKVVTEHFDGVIIVHIEHLELLDNNQNEQVEHDVSNNQDKQDVENGCEGTSTSLVGDTIWRRIEAIVHQPVPIFTSRDSKQ